MPVPPELRDRERTALRVSIAATAAFGALGVTWGLAIGSQMVLLDGVYAVIGLAVSWLLLLASRLAGQGPSHHYPFGREGATPIVIGVQGAVLLTTLLYAIVEAVLSIRTGGTVVSPGPAMAYSVVVTVGSVAVTAWLRRRSAGSELLTAEATAWAVATWRGVGMVVGFALLWALQDSGWSGAAPFIDPGMVLVTAVVFLPQPLRMIRSTLLELLERAPAPAVQAPVLDAIDAFRSAHGLVPPLVRMAKLGSKLYVEIDLLVPPETTVATIDRWRDELHAAVDDLPWDVWLVVDSSARPGWTTPDHDLDPEVRR